MHLVNWHRNPLEIEVIFKYVDNIDREWSVEEDVDRLLLATDLQHSDPKACLEIWNELAQRGSNMACLYLGDAYANGRNVERDIDLGMQWYQRASEAGSIEASHRLAFWLWYQGEFQAAVEILNKIGERGFSPALCVLGSIYFSDYDGHTIDSDIERSLNYWRSAERAGNLIAKRRLSIFLRSRKSTLTDKLRGYLKLFRLIPAFIYLSIKHPTSDRLRGWTYGAGIGITVPVY